MRFDPDSYVTVNERVERFYAKHPTGRLLTTVIEHDAEKGFILFRAEAYRNSDDALPSATGHAYEYKSNSGPQATSYIEVCETSAVGRALALLGFEVKRGIASREEVQKAERHQAPPAATDMTHAVGRLDGEILDALKIIGKGHEELNEWCQKKFKRSPWFALDQTQKHLVSQMLKSKIEEMAAKV